MFNEVIKTTVMLKLSLTFKKTGNNAGRFLFQIQKKQKKEKKNQDFFVSFQLGPFRWKCALSSTSFGPDVWMNPRLPTSSISSSCSSQDAGAYSYVAPIRSCELYTRGLKVKRLSPAGFQRAKSRICINSRMCCKCTGRTS